MAIREQVSILRGLYLLVLSRYCVFLNTPDMYVIEIKTMTFKFQDAVFCMCVHDVFTLIICSWNEMPCMICSRLEFQFQLLSMAIVGY